MCGQHDFWPLIQQRHEKALTEAHIRRLAKHLPATRRPRKLWMFNLVDRAR
jgi:hypothetical protein